MSIEDELNKIPHLRKIPRSEPGFTVEFWEGEPTVDRRPDFHVIRAVDILTIDGWQTLSRGTRIEATNGPGPATDARRAQVFHEFGVKGVVFVTDQKFHERFKSYLKYARPQWWSQDIFEPDGIFGRWLIVKSPIQWRVTK